MEEIIKNIPKNKIYYQDNHGIVIHADCLDILPLIPDKSVDLVLTDPPYGIAFKSPRQTYQIEISRDYCQIAAQRLSQEVLF